MTDMLSVDKSAPPTLRDRIGHWTARGYRVIVETPTSAQLVCPKQFQPLVFIAAPIYLLEYLWQRDKEVYIAVDAGGAITETGSATKLRLNQRLTLPERLGLAVLILVAFTVALVAIRWLTGT